MTWIFPTQIKKYVALESSHHWSFIQVLGVEKKFFKGPLDPFDASKICWSVEMDRIFCVLKHYFDRRFAESWLKFYFQVLVTFYPRCHGKRILTIFVKSRAGMSHAMKPGICQARQALTEIINYPISTRVCHWIPEIYSSPNISGLFQL